MKRLVNPLGGETINQRAGCGKSARPVRREERSKPTGLTYLYPIDLFNGLLDVGRGPLSSIAWGMTPYIIVVGILQENQSDMSANRLIHETSPYLLQHAHNPVHWYPWGPEAFQQARADDKPLFLSVGYSTCYWCHVMERESFENHEIAQVLNESFIAIKVDREERPDIDEQYMLAGELLAGRGGWPNSVWLTAEGKPWMAGTYFPPVQFKAMLNELARIWRTRRADVEKQADQLTNAIREAISGISVSLQGRGVDWQLIERAIDESRRTFDAEHGGFGGAPKFPPHERLLLLARQFRRTRDNTLLTMLTTTLDAMARGGFHDQLSGGFHRYATDRQWLLPHFEKMLYDNAQLLRAYTEGYLRASDENYREVVRDIFAWLEREMTDPEGAFYCALDAESEQVEGKFYVWRYDEVMEILGQGPGRLFAEIFDLEPDGNYVEQATGLRPGTNVLHLPQPLDEFAREKDLDLVKLKANLHSMREKLLTARATRTRPHRDDKILAGWNGLMIGSLAHAGFQLEEPSFIDTAVKAGRFILASMSKDGRLLRSYRTGQARIPAFLDDYTYFIRGLLDLYEATEDRQWLDNAARLANIMLDDFEDKEHGGFFFTSSGHEKLLARSKNLTGSGNIPSGNGVAAEVLLRLWKITGSVKYRQSADRTLAAFSGLMWQMPQAAESLIQAAALSLEGSP
jgi:uncharacterized protein